MFSTLSALRDSQTLDRDLLQFCQRYICYVELKLLIRLSYIQKRMYALHCVCVIRETTYKYEDREVNQHGK